MNSPLRLDKKNIILYLAATLSAFVIAFVLSQYSAQYALMLALGIGLIVATFHNTKIAIYILIFSMLLSPEFGSRTTSGEGFTLRIDDIILGIIVLTWLVKSAIYRELKTIYKTPLHQTFFYYLAACIISTSLGILRHDVHYLTGIFFVFKYFEYFMIFFMVHSYIKTKQDIKDFFGALIITFVLVVIIAYLQIPSGQRLTAPFEGEGGEPNTLGGFLLLVMSVNFGVIFFSDTYENKYFRRIMMGITMASVLPFLLTNSRGSWVAGIPVAISFILMKKSRNITLIFVVLLLALSPFVIPEQVLERVTYTFKEQQGYARTLQEEVGGVILDTSASERIRSWRRAFNDLPEHIIFGYGITGWRFMDAQYIRTLIETGVVGLITFFYMLYAITKGIWDIHKTTQDNFFRGLTIGMFVATLGMITHGIGANTFIIIRIMEPFYLLCGMVFAIPKIENREGELLNE